MTKKFSFNVLFKLRFILGILLIAIGGCNAYASLILVENTADSGPGSLRAAIASASDSDTILINTKGTITLLSQINIDGFNDLTIIGPYPKHNTIRPGIGWSGSLFNIKSCSRILVQGLSFRGGYGTTRHVLITNCPDVVTFKACLFENGDFPSGDGGSVRIDDAEAAFTQCSFISNTGANGGAMHVEGMSEVELINTTFSENFATDKAGALSLAENAEVTSYHCTYVYNNSSFAPTTIRGTGGTEFDSENNAVGDNGTDRQIILLGSGNNYGGNRIKLNFLGESTDLGLPLIGDIFGASIVLGLRDSILEDGFGLKYWPIVDATSDLINVKSSSIRTPIVDCRNAPRVLKANGSDTYPDAGAAEYTHLRVINTSGNKAVPNSLLWALESPQRDDPVNFIEFDIPVPSPISMLSVGQMSVEAYIINGYTQPGSAVPGPNEIGFIGLTRAVILIDLIDGSSNSQCLRLMGGSENSTLLGLRIQSFGTEGLDINTSQNAVYGCEIGIDAIGASNGSGNYGIKVDNNNTTIGGWEHWQRNVISGNGQSGASISCNIGLSSGTFNLISGNIIGGSPNGIGTLGSPFKTKNGIFVSSDLNQIGGSLVNSGNIIGDNNIGIYLSYIGDYSRISKNQIGVGWDDLTAIGNDSIGIYLNGADDALIGGLTPRLSNHIAHNGTGISLKTFTTSAINNQILGNSIHSNLEQGIDLGNNGIVVPNDGMTSSSEDNDGLDFPVLLSASNCDLTQTIINYELSVPTGTYRVEFFSNSSPDPTNGEGETFLGYKTITVTSNPQSFIDSLGILLASSESVSATLTDLSNNNTSEFGTNVAVSGGLLGTINYADVCFGAVATPSIVGDSGGVFSFDGGDPGDGAVLDPTTGALSNGAEGATYSIVYAFPDFCANGDTTTCSISSVDETFTIAEFCPESTGLAVPTITGGLFELVPTPLDGAYIVPDSGIFYNGVEGETYTVQYILTFDGCTDTGFATVNVIETDATFTMADFCPIAVSSAATPVTPGGTFSIVAPLGDGATINASTGAITGGVEGTTYSIKYTVGVCAKEFILDVDVIVTDETFDFPDFCPETIGMPSSVTTPGGTFYFEVDADGAAINPATGFITDGVEGTIYSVIYQVGVCGDKDTVPTLVKTVNEEFVFDDFCVVDDSSGTGPIAPDPDIVNYYLIDADDGSSINEVTGIIYSPQEGTTYTVIDSVFQDGCWQDDTVLVQAILVNELFSINDICFGDDAVPSVAAALSDTFFFALPPLDDAVSIDPTEGIVTNGAANQTYHVRRIAYNETCADSMDVSFKVILLNTDFSYGEFCPGPISPTPIPVVAGGIYSLETPAIYGEGFVTGTGVIINPHEGETYNVIYMRSDSTCVSADTLTVTVTLVEEGFTFEDFCWGESSSPGTPIVPGGKWSFGLPFPGGSAEIDTVSGIISDATEGFEYYVVHELTVGSCTQEDSLLVTAIGVDETFEYPPICVGGPSLPAIAVTSGGTFSFFEPPLDAATIDPSTGVLNETTEGAEYTIQYTVNDLTGTCSESSIETITVVSLNESFTTTNFCAAFDSDMPLPAVSGGTYSFAPDFGDGASIDLTTGIISDAIPGTTYLIEYTLSSGACSEVDTNSVIAYPSEDASFDLIDHCANTDVEATLLGTTGGLFEFFPVPGDAAVIDPTTGLISNSTGNTYTVRYITPGTSETCSDTLVKTIELFNTPLLIALESAITIYCPEQELSVIHVTEQEDAFTVYWYPNPEGIDALDSTFSFLPTSLSVGENIFYAQAKSVDGCLSEIKSFTLVLSDISNMFAGPDLTICMGSAAQLEAFGGNTYLWTTTVPLADYSIPNPIAFSLNEEDYAVRITNTDHCSVFDTVKVTFLTQNDCGLTVNNAFSPNDDGTNDFWYIDNLINYMPNTVYVYNRWGNEVNKIENYDNINAYWDGTDVSGKALPNGTYFYVVITENQLQNQAGWVQIVR